MKITAGFLGTLFFALSGLAIGVMSLSPPDFELAKEFAVVATLCGCLGLGAWALSVPSRSGLLGSGLAGVVVVVVCCQFRFGGSRGRANKNAATLREEASEHPKYAGLISQDSPNVRLASSAGKASSQIEIGNSGTKFAFWGTPGTPLFHLPGPSDLTVEVINGEVKVSTQIRDEGGRLIAEIFRNEWTAAPSPLTWDRNYSKDALEVIDPTGNVVLQVKSLPDRIQLQGEWHDKNGGGLRLVQSDDPASKGGFIIKLPPDRAPQIHRLFVYPSALDLGELAR